MSPLPAALAAYFTVTSLTLSDLVTADKPFGYIGPFVIAALTAFALYRTGATRAHKAAADGWKQAFEQKDRENRDLRRKVEGQAQRLARLEALPNLARMEQVETYFRRAEARHDEVLAVLNRIDTHLNGGTT